MLITKFYKLLVWRFKKIVRLVATSNLDLLLCGRPLEHRIASGSVYNFRFAIVRDTLIKICVRAMQGKAL